MIRNVPHVDSGITPAKKIYRVSFQRRTAIDANGAGIRSV